MKNHSIQKLVGYFVWLTMCFVAPLQAQNPYAEGWKALEANNFAEAKTQFAAALKNPKTAVDAGIALMTIAGFDDQEELGTPIWNQLKPANPYPYLFALWQTDALAGGYGQKKPDQLKLIKAIGNDQNAPSTLRASAKYHLGHHLLTTRDFKTMNATWGALSNVQNWQLAGPFDNISGSGFDKNYAPIDQPQADAVFKSTNGSDTKWFTPTVADTDGWQTPTNNVRWKTGIIYAQSFVTATDNTDATLALGLYCNMKVWVNDRLVLAEQEERHTDYDVFSVPVKLNKGVNRILVQIGFQDENDASFALRLLGRDGNLLPGITSEAAYKAYTKDTGGGLPNPTEFWAEAFFKQKIADEPDNLINYVLLTRTYFRSLKHQDALEVIQKALKKSPENLLLQLELLKCYNQNGNQTSFSEILQHIVDQLPESNIALQYKFNKAMGNENFDEAKGLLGQRVKLFGNSAEMMQLRAKVLDREKKTEELVKLCEEGYKLYPEDYFFNEMQYVIALQLRKNKDEALAVWEKYLKKKFSVSTAFNLASNYMQFGMNDKALLLYEIVQTEISPEDPTTAVKLFNYYLDKKQGKKARTYLNYFLGLSPYSAGYWDNAAKLANQEGNEADELAANQKSLHLDPNDFVVRRRIRELEKKKDLFENMAKVDAYQVIKAHKTPPQYGDYDAYYVLDDMQTVVYPDLNAETWHTYVVKIMNKKGVDAWKETGVGYNASRQKMIIDKSEVVKANGSKIAAERSGTDLVFPNLEVGDYVYIRYHTMSYAYGRMGREFWDKYVFSTFTPIEHSRYSLLTPKDMKLDYRMENGTLEPVIKDIDDQKLYVWELKKEPAMKEEPISLRFPDIAKVLHISTVRDWKTITDWYADVSALQAKPDFYVRQLVKTIVPDGSSMTETQKARAIYDWIVKNIRYSSVSFRQSGYVPQRASRVIQTRLGDCKDLSTLYASLAREVGLNANLVLINTRDNGIKDMILPSMEFNHCIVRVVADQKTSYLELTDNTLPFGALPLGDQGATALDIPFKDSKVSNQMFPLDPANRILDVRESYITVNIKNRDINIATRNVRQGMPASSFRQNYLNLTKQKAIETIQQSLGSDSKNPVVVKDISYGDIDNANDSLHFTVNYTIKGEVAEIGDLKTVKVPYYNDFIAANSFQDETRTLPLNFAEWNGFDRCYDEIDMVLPEGKAFENAPKNIELTFKGIQYSIRFEKKSPTLMKVTREVKVKRDNVSAAEYVQFKEFVDEVVGAEAKFISFK